MSLALDLLLALALMWSAWRSLATHDLSRAVVLFIVFGLLMALAWARLDAPDIALAEAAIGAGLAAAAAAGAVALSRPFAAALGAYLAMQALYSLALKRVPLVDVIVIAAGFVLRAIAGARAIRAAISPWLLLCAFLLALFLALCKRRGERHRLDQPDRWSARPALAGYGERLLDQLIAIVASATIACYSIYTLWPDTIAKFHTHRLVYTVPFVIFGLFRYLDLVYRHDEGGEPEHVLLTDLPTLANLALYVAAVLAILLGPH